MGDYVFDPQNRINERGYDEHTDPDASLGLAKGLDDYTSPDTDILRNMTSSELEERLDASCAVGFTD